MPILLKCVHERFEALHMKSWDKVIKRDRNTLETSDIFTVYISGST